MFTPWFRTALRPVARQASQCLRQQQQQRTPFIARDFIQSQMRIRMYATRRTTFESAKMLWRAQPFATTLAFSIIATCMGLLVYVNYFYSNYIIGAFHQYPEEVAKELRKALYYKDFSLEPNNSLKYFQKALKVTEQLEMDPFSNEVMGIKIKMAELFEQIQKFDMAINVYEILKRDNLAWMELLGEKKGNEEKRTRVLGKTVAISVKLADLYSGPNILEKERAEDCLVWAVETVLKEAKRRAEQGGGYGEWIPDEEVGASFEFLARLYEEKDQHYLAAPLFLQALALSPSSSCHTAVIMNNLSISLAQQLPPSVPGQAPTSRAALISNARQWAEKAIQIAAKIQPPNRTEECDVGCATATHNLGEFAEMDGDIREARKRYEEARSLSKAVGFAEGVQNSEAALQRIAGK